MSTTSAINFRCAVCGSAFSQGTWIGESGPFCMACIDNRRVREAGNYHAPQLTEDDVRRIMRDEIEKERETQRAIGTNYDTVSNKMTVSRKRLLESLERIRKSYTPSKGHYGFEDIIVPALEQLGFKVTE